MDGLSSRSSDRNEPRHDIRDSSAIQRDVDASNADHDAASDDDQAEQRDRDSEADTHHAPEALAALELARNWALRDRLRASNDRVRSANDRLRAKADRMDAAHDRFVSSNDDLTGAYRRDAGLRELARDLEFAQRTGQEMVIGFIDVDGLKLINDNAGHAAGDDALRRVAESLRSLVRKYDLVVRLGGDEFVFSALGMDLEQVRNRMARVNEILQRIHRVSISVGLTQTRTEDSLKDAIERADRDLYSRRQMSRDHDAGS